MEIQQASLEEWLSILKPYQQNTLKSLVALHGEEEAARLWIDGRGPINVVTFGGEPNVDNSNNYWKSVKRELRGFLCENPKYETVRTEILQKSNLINVAMSTKIAMCISPYVGISVALLTPTIALLLKSISKIAINAYCAMADEA